MTSVQTLQLMLDYLARTVPGLIRVADTGYFDENTMEAVMLFQRDNGMPVTGVVDQETWDAIYNAYSTELFVRGAPPPLHVFPDRLRVVDPIETGAEVALAQAMLLMLKFAVDGIEDTDITGKNTDATTRNLRQIQYISGMEDALGAFDRSTWALLSGLYRSAITRNGYDTFPL